MDKFKEPTINFLYKKFLESKFDSSQEETDQILYIDHNQKLTEVVLNRPDNSNCISRKMTKQSS